MQPKPYKIIRADRAAVEATVGETVFYCRNVDYGCADDDTRMTGIHHVSITRDPEGGYPFFTIPREDIASEQSR